MEEQDLYQSIFKRKSIRNYDLTPLDDNILTKISEEFNFLKPLDDNIKVELKIISSNNVNSRMMKKAPHYIAVFSEVKEGYLTNVGFMLQKMDLFFSANNIGSCWQGIPKPSKDVLNSSDLEFIILLAFGKSSEPLHRSNISEFKRKSLEEINDVSGVKDILEAVRIAPSATNNQPWFFTGDETIIHVYCRKPNLLKGLFIKKFILIDMGIALYHLKLAANHFDKHSKIIYTDVTIPKNYEYIASLKME